jgi:gas vesicle protein
MLKNLITNNLPILKAVFLAGAIIGGLLGGAMSLFIGISLGVLFAPKAGKELRGDIANGFMSLFGLNKEKKSTTEEYY